MVYPNGRFNYTETPVIKEYYYYFLCMEIENKISEMVC